MKEAKSISEPRLTSRPWVPQDLVDALQEMIDEMPRHYHDDRRTTLCMARDFLEEHFAENKWISVKDRLPEKGTYCLCYLNNKSMKVLYYTTWGKRFVEFPFTSTVYAVNVTHWMPLPEPPKGVSDNA